MIEDGRERYWRQIREMQEELELTHQEARRQWRNYYDAGGGQRRPIRRLELAIRASTSGPRMCPFCRSEILDEEPDHTCAACGARYHQDCFEEELSSQCATLGCTGRRIIRRRRRDVDVVERARQELDNLRQDAQLSRRSRRMFVLAAVIVALIMLAIICLTAWVLLG